MASTITKIGISILISIGMLIGFLGLVTDISNNYGVSSTFTDEFTAINDDLLEDFGNFTNAFQANTENVQEVNFFSVVPAVIVGAMVLPFKLIFFTITATGKVFAILGLPVVLGQLLIILLQLLIAFTVFRIIMRQSGDI